MLIAWMFLLYPLAGTLVADAPFTSRAIIGAPLFTILTGLGIYAVGTHTLTARFKFRTFLIVLILFSFLINFTVFVQFYFVRYPLYSSDFWGWQYGPKEIISYFIANQTKYDDLYMQGAFNSPEIFLKFYAPHSCANCRIGNPEDKYDPSRNQLFALTPLYVTEHNLKFVPQKVIYYPNHTVAFEIGEIVQ